ncbi:MAG: glycosyltransferase [Gemmataceae bacterium]|nr:glycosyltransferase [Gemmataceae bacterium]
MDAAPPTAAVSVTRATEPFSGMPLFRVAGYWQAPAGRTPPHEVEVWYDLHVATRCGLTRSDAADIPPGYARYDFGTQLPVEPGIDEVAVVVGAEVLYRSAAGSIADPAPPPQPSRLGRAVRSAVSGEVVSPRRWAGRVSRLSEKLLELRQRVEGKLLARRFRPRSVHDAYVQNTAITPRLRAAMAADQDGWRHRPTFSILVPVYNVAPKWLAKAVESVRDQIYPHWELCLADDASTDPELVRYLNNLPADPRIKLARRAENGHICRATNTAAELATGEFVALLDHDDELAPHALWAVAERLQHRPDADLLYSDEDKIDEEGRRYDGQFKPGWSPELLLSYNFVNHFTVIRRSVFEAAGRFRPGFEGSQDHDLLLRVAERTGRVEHVPGVLYHWRSLPTSTAGEATVKPYVHTAGRKTVAEALARRGVTASLYVPPFAEKLGLPVLGLDGPDDGPAVAVVVHGDPVAAAQTAAVIHRTTDYRNYMVVVAGGGADALNETAAGRPEELLLFLEAGAEPAGRRWLSRLVANLTLPGVGAAGGKLVDADGTVIDAGTVLGMRDGTAPAAAFAGLKPDEVSYYFTAEVTRTVSAVSGRCLLTRRSDFHRLGGFDVGRFPRSLWDVDYGLRLGRTGLRSAFVAGAEVRVDPTPYPPPRCGEGGPERPGRLGASSPSLLRGGGRGEGSAWFSPPLPPGEGEGKAEGTGRGWGLPTELLALRRAHGRRPDPYHNPACGEFAPWRPAGDGPLSLPAEAARPPVRALVVAHNLNNPEGAPRYLSEIVLGLRDRGAIAPTVFSPLGGAGAKVYADAGIPVDVRESAVRRRFVDGLWSPREYAAAQKLAAGVLRDHRPEVVVANTLTTFPLVEAAARAGVPAVWVIHESYSADHLARLFPPFARRKVERAFALAARVVPASHATAALFERLNSRGNVRVLHNGLDPRPFDAYLRRVSRAAAAARVPGDPAKKRIVAVGTVCERKGQHTLVEAAARLAQARDDFEVHLVGARSGIPYVEYVRHLIGRSKLESVVHLVPETDDVWAFLRAADVFACTSHMETYSRAVLEALAFGLPVVSTRCCGADEQLYWGSNALPFGFGDAAGLAAQLGRLLADDALRAEMGRQSRAAFDNHLGHDEMLDRYAAVIRSAARTGPRAGTAFAPAAEPVPARRAA